jgi:hypothetical protein
MTNQAKVLLLGGAQGFQTKEGMEDLVWPKKFMLYADLEE